MKGERKILESKKGNIIRQIFINISHTRGLLWTDIVEGILFDQYGISRSLSNEVKVDESSLSNMMDLGSKENVVNYILVLDYLVDYLKNEYKLGNSEISKLINVTVGWQKVILRRARTKITGSNVAVLSFLELMNDTSPAFLDDERKEIIQNFIKANGITRKNITEYAPVFPDRVMRNLIESEVVYNVAP